jgi:outer membrane protein OmpA-like peptidoglycan-associated protein
MKYTIIFLLFSQSIFAQTGLRGTYFNGTEFQKQVGSRIDPKIQFNWQEGTSPMVGVNQNNYSIRWIGYLKAPETGIVTFSAKVDDGIRVWVGKQKVIDAWGDHDHGFFQGAVTMKAGDLYDIKIEYFNGIKEGELEVSWQLPSAKIPSPIGASYLYTEIPKLKPTPPIPAATPKPQKPKPTVPAPPKSSVPVLDTVKKYTPKNVLFLQAKAILLPQSSNELDQLAAMLIKNPRKELLIEGHTDNVGDAKANLRLSQERADAVAAYLIKKGVNENRIRTAGYGSSRPVSTDNSTEGHQLNRRVEFVITNN